MRRPRVDRIKYFIIPVGVILSLVMLFSDLAQTDGQQEQIEQKISIIDNPFGVLEFLNWNHSWNNYKYPNKEELQRVVNLMKKAGVGFVRMDFLWDDIEPQPDKFDFEKYDYIVDLLSQNNIKILGILDYTALWASSCGSWNCSPIYSELFTRYASRVINRYKDKIKHWEVWNEPDSSIYWQPQDGLKTYCALLKEVYLTAKKVDPECVILNGGLSQISSINRLYENGAKEYFDILNIHIFESPLNTGAKKRILSYPKLAYKIMRRNGDSHKKIWITEIGCPGVRRWLQVKNWWLGRNPTETQQADWVKYIYTEFIKQPNVEIIFWAFFRDCNRHWNNGIDYFGLIRWDYSLKPAFKSYKSCADNWKKTQTAQ